MASKNLTLDVTDIVEPIREFAILNNKVRHRLSNHARQRIERMMVTCDYCVWEGLRLIPSDALLAALVDLRVADENLR